LAEDGSDWVWTISLAHGELLAVPSVSGFFETSSSASVSWELQRVALEGEPPVSISQSVR
jgi:hypothetical protein